MSLRLELRASEIPIDLAGVTPHWARAQSLADIERHPLWQGNRQVPLAELFAVSRSAANERIELHGDCRLVHHIGEGLDGGELRVVGNVGRHAGARMSGGELVVEGDAGDWAGVEMHGGLLLINGSASSALGGAYAGSPRGMTGGTVLVGRDAGDEIGRQMRRGTIAVSGSIGQLAGYGMLAGTILVLGACGLRPGANMRRGTIAALGPPPVLLPTFRLACRCRPTFLPLVLRQVASLGLPIPKQAQQIEVDLYSGDLLASGRGEILLVA